MSAPRERRRIDDLPLEARPEQVAAPVPDPRADVLALQRGAGNAAVATLLQRKEKPPQPPRAGGWNEKGQDVAGTLRIPVTGVKGGNTKEDVQGGSDEGAAGKAIVIVPDGVDLAAQPEVLLFFHGMGNAGFRERTTDDASRGAKGTVHDVEADRIPQQLAASGRNMIGVLPQGTNAATFGIADPQQYVIDVLALAAAQLPALRPGVAVPAAIKPGRIVVAGHSGGGRAAFAAAKAMTRKPPATDDEWIKAPPLFLFDGINGPGELGVIAGLMEEWLAADLVRLQASADADKLLDRRGLRLRSTHTTSDVYTATNVGGKFDVTKDTGERDENNKPKTVTVTITVTKPNSLKGRIDTWFATNAKLPAAVVAKWRKQYDVPERRSPAGTRRRSGPARSRRTRPSAVPRRAASPATRRRRACRAAAATSGSRSPGSRPTRSARRPLPRPSTRWARRNRTATARPSRRGRSAAAPPPSARA